MDLKKLIKTGIPFLMISFLLIPKHLIYLFESLDLFKFVFYIYNLNNWKSNKRFNVSVPLTVILKENPCFHALRLVLVSSIHAQSFKI